MEYFTFFRREGSEVCRNWTCFKDLGPDPLQSPPVIVLCRVITGTEFMTLPGFSPETSASSNFIVFVGAGCQAAATRSMGFTCAGNVVQLLGIPNSMAKKAVQQSCTKLL